MKWAELENFGPWVRPKMGFELEAKRRKKAPVMILVWRQDMDHGNNPMSDNKSGWYRPPAPSTQTQPHVRKWYEALWVGHKRLLRPYHKRRQRDKPHKGGRGQASPTHKNYAGCSVLYGSLRNLLSSSTLFSGTCGCKENIISKINLLMIGNQTLKKNMRRLG